MTAFVSCQLMTPTNRAGSVDDNCRFSIDANAGQDGKWRGSRNRFAESLGMSTDGKSSNTTWT